MASLKDTEKFTQRLDELVDELQSELRNGNVDFEKLVAVADELSEYADGLAETFGSVNDTLMERLQGAKQSSRGSGSKSESSKSDRSKATANAS